MPTLTATTLGLVRCALALACVAPAVLAAQGAAKQDGDGTKPPPGMCRIWVDGVPADKQPAPTSCALALKNKPANGRVIFGEPAPSRGPAPATAKPQTPPPVTPASSRSRDTTSKAPPKAPPRTKRDTTGKKS
ncbi:MAG TPA: hypothetical protein VE967_02395 [Gemmatimonadaceae bacterium]|nr:hypothetical protein [Gemmatimonadaceae bacterium]